MQGPNIEPPASWIRNSVSTVRRTPTKLIVVGLRGEASSTTPVRGEHRCCPAPVEGRTVVPQQPRYFVSASDRGLPRQDEHLPWRGLVPARHATASQLHRAYPSQASPNPLENGRKPIAVLALSPVE